MANNYSNIIQYFKSCYQADARDIQLMDFFGRKIEHRLVLPDSDLLTGKNLHYPVPSVWGADVEKDLHIYAKEKNLYAFSLFLVGRYNVAGKNQRVVAPLILHPLELEEIDEVYYLSIKEGHHIFNPFFFQLANSEGSSSEAKEDLYQYVDNNFIGFDDCVFISDIIKKHFSNIDTTDFLQFPDLIKEKDIKNLLKVQKGDSYVLVSAAGVGMMKKSLGNQGIYTELNEIAAAPSISKPLCYLFDESIEPQQYKIKNEMVYAPVLLSHAQAQICRNKEQDVSVVIGPPGTGKSFTIAALATDAVANGLSVLIASKNNQAVDVIADKIDQEMGLPDLPVRAGRRDYLKKLKSKVESIIQYRYHGDSIMGVKRNRMQEELYCNRDDIQSMEHRILTKENKEIDKGKFITNDQLWFKKWRLKAMANASKGATPISTYFRNYSRLLNNRNWLMNRFLKYHIEHEWKWSDYTSLIRFQKAIRARTGSKRDQLFNEIEWNEVFKALPIWLVNFQDIHKVLPNIPEMFDLVIIDEASQCDIASAIPILQRGKRAIIVGDPKQLRHISFLSGAEQLTIRKKKSIEHINLELLDYRNMSILDLALERCDKEQQMQVLNEHFRSQPDIIAFSNQSFYHNRLKIMTSYPAKEHERNLFLHIVKDGKRHAKGYNEEEAAAIIQHVLRIIQADTTIDSKLCRSIGILSPFRGQVEFIQQLVHEQIPLNEIERHRILIGTPHSFQGEERDMMFLSFTIDSDSNRNVIRYMEKEDVLNVSITRAKNEQHVYVSRPLRTLGHDSIVSKYLHHIVETPQSSSSASISTIKDEFMEEVVQELENMDTSTIHQHYEVAGLELDLVIVHNGRTLSIDLVGFPGAYESTYHIECYRLLSRMNIPVYPISYSEWYFNREYAIQHLKRFVQHGD